MEMELTYCAAQSTLFLLSTMLIGSFLELVLFLWDSSLAGQSIFTDETCVTVTVMITYILLHEMILSYWSSLIDDDINLRDDFSHGEMGWNRSKI